MQFIFIRSYEWKNWGPNRQSNLPKNAQVIRIKPKLESKWLSMQESLSFFLITYMAPLSFQDKSQIKALLL